MMKRIIALIIVLCMVLGGCMADKNEVTSGEWSVGFGYSEIIPDGYDKDTDSFNKVYYVAGYNNDHHATNILDPQCARSAYISDGRGNDIIITAVDCVGMSKNDIEKIKKNLKDLDVDAIHIAATHTHAGIDTLGLWGPLAVDGKDDEFMERVFESTESAIRQAYDNAKTGTLYIGSADTGNIQRDSRLPEIYDRNIHRIRFEPSDGSSGLQIISYDAHAEALRSANTKVSADYPYYMGQVIKEETGDDYIYFAGAVGGLIMTHELVNPMETNVRVTGERLAENVLSIENERELEPILSSKTKEFDIQLDNQLFAAMSFLGVLSTQAVKGGGEYGLALETEVSLINLGGEDGLNIAMVPGEIFPELVMGGDAGPYAANPDAENPPSLRSLLGENTIVYGLCNDEIGYIVTPNDFYLNEEKPYLENAYDRFQRRHYEETNSVGINAAWEIYNAFKDIAENVDK